MRVEQDELEQAAAEHRVYHRAIEGIELPEESVDHTITDPPYSKRAQDNARKLTHRGVANKSPAFAPLDDERRNRWAAWIARVTRRWAIVFSDHEGSKGWELDLARYGMEFVRYGLWVRTHDVEIVEGGEKPSHSGAPQLTGDRPGQGHEVLVIAHAVGRRMRWNGGGRAAVYTAPVVRGAERYHETQKPITLMRDILHDFARPGEIICDPFAGAGTTAAAAKNLGMRSVSVELDARYAEYAQRRVAAATVAA